MSLKKFKKIKKSSSRNFVSEKIANIIKILNLIDSGQIVTPSSLAEELAVSKKTIFRYIRTIEFSGIPIFYDRKKKSYAFTENFSLKKIFLEPDEIAALGTLKSIFSKMGLPSDFPLVKTLDRLKAITLNWVKDKRLPVYIDIGKRIESEENKEKIRIINLALKRGKMVNIKYPKDKTGEVISRDVAPYRLYFTNGSWYLIGKCFLGHDIRTFAVDRISEINLTEKPFVIPPGFSLREYLAKSFENFRSKDTDVALMGIPCS